MMMIGFFFNDTATTEIYTLSLHDALPIWLVAAHRDDLLRAELLRGQHTEQADRAVTHHRNCLAWSGDRKSTRLNSSHANISYAVFCLKKKNKEIKAHRLHNHLACVLHHGL